MTNQNYEQHFFKENVNSNYSENVTEISFQTLFIYFVDKNVFIIWIPLDMLECVYIPSPEHILFVSHEVPVGGGRNDCVGHFDFCSKLKQNFISINQIISRI